MTRHEILDLLSRYKVTRLGHFRLSSGRHTDEYFVKDIILADTELTDRLSEALVKQIRLKQISVDVVIGPESGGSDLARTVACRLNKHSLFNKVMRARTELTDNGPCLNPYFTSLIAGRRVLITEDVITTGQSVKQVVELVRQAGGQSVAVAALINRNRVTKKSLNIPELITLLNLNIKSYPKKQCPLCQKNIPINTDFGHG